MTITHAIIKQKFHENIEKRQKRKLDLQDVGEKLLKKYKASLSTPSNLWEDSNGHPKNYVSAGFRNDKGFFQQASLSSIDIDENLVFIFVISTVLDEVKGGIVEYAEVEVSIYKEVGSYHILIGDKRKSFRVVSINAADAFDNVCNAIKEEVISCCTDPRLDF